MGVEGDVIFFFPPLACFVLDRQEKHGGGERSDCGEHTSDGMTERQSYKRQSGGERAVISRSCPFGHFD